MAPPSTPGHAGRQGGGRAWPYDLAASFITSSLYTTATYPIHRVKILLQTQDANPRIISGKVKRYSFAHSFARLIREQGMLGLWHGNTPYLLRHVPSITMSFTLKDSLRASMPAVDATASPWTALGLNALSGGLAGAMSLAMVYPFEFATIRLAADVGGSTTSHQFGRGMVSAWQQAIAQEGLCSIYQGFGVALASVIAYKALYFGLYDTAKALIFAEYGVCGTHTGQLRFNDSGDRSSSSSSNSCKSSSPNSLVDEEHTQRRRLLNNDIASDGSHALTGSVGRATQPPPLLQRAALATFTTYCAATITYPLDILRKRMVVDVGAKEKQYGASVAHAIRTIWAREGLRGFYRFYGFDMVFRLGGGMLLVGYDLLQQHGRL